MPADIINELKGICTVRLFAAYILFHQDSLNTYPSVFSIPFYTFHAIVADLFRIKVTPVAFPAADTLPVIQHTLLMDSHGPEHLPVFIPYCNYTVSLKGRSSSNMVEMRTFTEEEYHRFFRGYRSDPMMDPIPFHYNREKVSRSYVYNHGGFREDYVHLGIFMNGKPVGSFQLKRMNPAEKSCEFGIILQNDSCKNQGIGTEAIRIGM